MKARPTEPQYKLSVTNFIIDKYGIDHKEELQYACSFTQLKNGAEIRYYDAPAKTYVTLRLTEKKDSGEKNAEYIYSGEHEQHFIVETGKQYFYKSKTPLGQAELRADGILVDFVVRDIGAYGIIEYSFGTDEGVSRAYIKTQFIVMNDSDGGKRKW